MNSWLVRLLIISSFTLIFTKSHAQHYQVGICKSWTANSTDTFYSREVTSFDSLDLKLFEEFYEMGNSNDTSWTSLWRIEYTYDSLNRKTSETPMFWNGTWQPLTPRKLYSYGSNSLLIVELSQQFYMGSYINQTQLLFSYNSNNDLISREKRNWVSGAWENDWKSIFNYDTAHHLLEWYSMYWIAGNYNTTGYNYNLYQFNGTSISSVLIYRPTDTIYRSYHQDTQNRDSIIYKFNCPTSACADSNGTIRYYYYPPFDTTIHENSPGGYSINTKKYNSFLSLIESTESSDGGGGGFYADYDSTNLLLRNYEFNWVSHGGQKVTDCMYYHVFSDSLTVRTTIFDTLCREDSAFIILSVTGGIAPYSVSWDDSPGNHRLLRWVDPDSSMSYGYTVTDSIGNTVSGSVEVRRYFYPNDLPAINGLTDLCPGDSITLTATFPYPNINYIWRLGSLLNWTPQFTVYDTGVVSLTAFYQIAQCNVASYITYDTVALQIPKPYLGNDTTLCIGETLLLNPGSFTSYLWQDSSTQPTFLVENISGFPGNFSYSVSVTDTNQCMSNTDSIIVTYDICSNIGSVPNHFIHIFHDPIAGKISISVEEMQGEITLNLFDMKGINCLSKKINQKAIIDVSDFASGLYILKISNNLIRINKKIVLKK